MSARSTPNLALLGGAVALLIAAGLWASGLFAQAEDDDGAGRPKAPPAAGEAPSATTPKPAEGPMRTELVEPLPVPAPAPAPVTAAAEARVTYPGGVFMPPLNGVEDAIELQWGDGPFTPIIGVENGPGGWQWYVHENGARSTVAVSAVNGIPQTIGIVAEPEQALPMVGPDGVGAVPGTSGPGSSGQGR